MTETGDNKIYWQGYSDGYADGREAMAEEMGRKKIAEDFHCNTELCHKYMGDCRRCSVEGLINE